MTILLGLLGLSVVIVVHEFGHYLAARLAGVEVETFSIGWGPRLFGFTKGKTEWRISALPLGGYCRMKGEEEFRTAIERKLPFIPRERGSFYGAAPFARILILVSGPLANLLLAALIFSFVSFVGIKYTTSPNKIVLASELAGMNRTLNVQAHANPNPADLAGLRTGDRVVAINGTAVEDYADIQEQISLNPEKALLLTVERENERLSIPVIPRLDKNTGQGLIGIYSWVEPVVASLDPEGSARLAGLRTKDRIVTAQGKNIRNTIDLMAALSERPGRLDLTVLREGKELSFILVLSYTDQGSANLGIEFSGIEKIEKADSAGDAVVRGLRETRETLGTTLKGIGLLFRGVDLLKAVSGPARITYMVGNAASESLKSDGLSGILPILSFLAFLSIGLFIMNLLPIPALDGGQIILSLVEAIKRSPLSTTTIYRYQFVGSAMIMLLFVLVTFSDILFFAGK
ncbi:MAG: regulator of sigma E protease [Spirochaetes bacterium]|nr:MAG: regulator of sigma E protease [Spirochaetota bacterium]